MTAGKLHSPLPLLQMQAHQTYTHHVQAAGG